MEKKWRQFGDTISDFVLCVSSPQTPCSRNSAKLQNQHNWLVLCSNLPQLRLRVIWYELGTEPLKWIAWILHRRCSDVVWKHLCRAMQSVGNKNSFRAPPVQYSSYLMKCPTPSMTDSIAKTGPYPFQKHVQLIPNPANVFNARCFRVIVASSHLTRNVPSALVLWKPSV